MTGTHPYISGAGNISQMVNHLRKAFPSTVDSNTVKRLGLAPNNESYLINALQFVGVIDDEGNKTKEASSIFSAHKDDDFVKGFRELVKGSYNELFELHGDGAWELGKDELITFFRRADETSAVIGARQANTFLVFAALSGFGEVPAKKEILNRSEKPKQAKPAKAKAQHAKSEKPNETAAKSNVVVGSKREIGLSVRVEINLPGDGTKETYDNIFKSIREHLIND